MAIGPDMEDSAVNAAIGCYPCFPPKTNARRGSVRLPVPLPKEGGRQVRERSRMLTAKISARG
jgi:hypothetical protein